MHMGSFMRTEQCLWYVSSVKLYILLLSELSICQEVRPVYWVLPYVLQYMLAGIESLSKQFGNNTHSYENSLPRDGVNEECVPRGAGNSNLNPTMMFPRRIYHYLDALVPPSNLRSCLLSLFIHCTYYPPQWDIRSAVVSNPHVALLEHLTAICMKSISTCKQFHPSQRILGNGPCNLYQVIKHSEWRLASEHTRR